MLCIGTGLEFKNSTFTSGRTRIGPDTAREEAPKATLFNDETTADTGQFMTFRTASAVLLHTVAQIKAENRSNGTSPREDIGNLFRKFHLHFFHREIKIIDAHLQVDDFSNLLEESADGDIKTLLDIVRAINARQVRLPLSRGPNLLLGSSQSKVRLWAIRTTSTRFVTTIGATRSRKLLGHRLLQWQVSEVIRYTADPTHEAPQITTDLRLTWVLPDTILQITSSEVQPINPFTQAIDEGSIPAVKQVPKMYRQVSQTNIT